MRNFILAAMMASFAAFFQTTVVQAGEADIVGVEAKQSGGSWILLPPMVRFLVHGYWRTLTRMSNLLRVHCQVLKFLPM